jgi:hypothetical protein
MPLIENSSYKKPFYYWNGHWETILPSMFRKIEGVTYQRQRLELNDGDFVDLDWVKQDSSKLVIITHGLEGNSDRHYAKGMAKFFFKMDGMRSPGIVEGVAVTLTAYPDFITMEPQKILQPLFNMLLIAIVTRLLFSSGLVWVEV